MERLLHHLVNVVGPQLNSLYGFQKTFAFKFSANVIIFVAFQTYLFYLLIYFLTLNKLF